ncbi:MAG: glycoside hydrolase family 92 protein [Flavobacteriales bacterium]|nr:glycoside hydrolase family 92 protein [Flavobacteriales bacterium]
MIFHSIIFVLLLLEALFANAQTDAVDRVNPLMGTKQILLLHGRTTPFVTPPFGMTHWTPQTRNSRINELSYYYGDRHIIGFRGSHKPAKWMGDYGYVGLMPGFGEVKTLSDERRLRFSHKHETSTPYFYSVDLKAKQGIVKAEMTATERCGLLRFNFPNDEDGFVIIEATQNPAFDGWIKVDAENGEIIGWNADRNSAITGPEVPGFKGYFCIKIDRKITSYGTWNGGEIYNDSVQIEGKNVGVWLRFADEKEVKFKVGSSFISIDQARDNLAKEIPDFDFERVEQECKKVWNDHLNRIEVEGADEDALDIFYTSMYHSLLFPRNTSEYGQYYSAFDDAVHDGDSYNDFSLWDTFRAQHPLLTIIAPERVDGMVRALLQMYQQGGYMPKWPNPTYTNIMIGTHADAVVADAVVKGFRGFNLDTAYAAVWKDAMVPPDGDSVKDWRDRAPWTSYEARSGLYWYKKLGYIPVDKTSESVSRTLESAYDDFCVAQVAKAVGKTEDHDYFMQRSKFYQNLYNPETKFMAPRNADGSWNEHRKWGFTEGGPWTYLFCVMQDVPGMIDLMGGKDAFVKRLDKGFGGIFRYIHENEPGHHYSYLYDYADAAWKTQKRVAHFRKTKYHNQPFGLNGDDDCGQMSAWYIFSSLGFYPVTPGTDVYAIGTPLFEKAVIHPNPNDPSIQFTILAKNLSKRNKYIKAAYLNGQRLEEPFLHHSDITRGGELIFEMDSRPNKVW